MSIVRRALAICAVILLPILLTAHAQQSGQVHRVASLFSGAGSGPGGRAAGGGGGRAENGSSVNWAFTRPMLSHRVVVLNEGEVIAEVNPNEAMREQRVRRLPWAASCRRVR
jgi:hypothetical protein